MKRETPPAPCRVRITKCSFEQGWYKNLIGEEFDVDNAGGCYDFVLWEDYINNRTSWRHISKNDCVRINNPNPMRLIQSIDPILNEISSQVFKDDLEMPFRREAKERIGYAMTLLNGLHTTNPDLIKYQAVRAAAILVRLISELPEETITI